LAQAKVKKKTKLSSEARIENDGSHAFSELMEELTYDPHSRSILFALTETAVVEGLRYNELYRSANQIFGESSEAKSTTGSPKGLDSKPKMSIKTFNEHLNRIVSTKLVERKEISRHEVRYRMKYFDEKTRFLSKEMANDIKLFQEAAQETIAFLAKAHLSDEETVKWYVGFFNTFLEILILKTLYLGVKLFQAKDPIHVLFLLDSTYPKIKNHVALAAAFLSTIPHADREIGDMIEVIQAKYEALAKKKPPKPSR
jgi:hypothetical protein